MPYSPDMEGPTFGHEAIAVVNKDNKAAKLWVEIYYMDRAPEKGFEFEILPERSHRIILGYAYQLNGSMKLPVVSNVPYSLKLSSEGDLNIQFTRVDSRSERLAVSTTVIPKSD